MKRKVLSAGVIVVRRAEGAWYYLLLRAFDYWDFPKGIIEEGEDPLQAARREVTEETGLEDLVFSWGHGYRETPPYGPHGKVARYYVAETHQAAIILPVNEELGRPEHHEYRWMSYEKARRFVATRVTPILEWTNALLTSETP